MDDAGAELRLRGEEFPIHMVESEVERLRASIWSNYRIYPSVEFDRQANGSVEKRPLSK
jgi:hypothetical protein